MDEATALCVGCLRTLDEIAAWSVLDDDARARVLGDAIARRARRALAVVAMPVARCRRADWYFDFVSPFAYLQSEQLATLAPRCRSAIARCCSRALLDAHGHKGPAEIPAKRAFTYRFVLWQRAAQGIPLKFPPEHPFNPLPLLRLAIACDCAPEAVHRIFRFVWRDGRLPDLPIEWAELTHDLGVADADARIADPEVKDALRRNTDEAIARGVFGVPTLAIGDELFWGADATADGRATTSRPAAVTTTRNTRASPRCRRRDAQGRCALAGEEEDARRRHRELTVGVARSGRAAVRRRGVNDRRLPQAYRPHRTATARPPRECPSVALDRRARVASASSSVVAEARHVAHLAAAARLGLAVEVQLRARVREHAAPVGLARRRRRRTRRTRCRRAGSPSPRGVCCDGSPSGRSASTRACCSNCDVTQASIV